MEIIDISIGNIVVKGVTNHASQEYEFSHFMPFSELVHSQREGKWIPSPSLAVSTSIAKPVVSVLKIKIDSYSDSDSIPMSKQEARNITGNLSYIQKIEKLTLCPAVLPPLERWNKFPVRCHMARFDQSHCLEKNRVDHTPLQLERVKGYIHPSFLGTRRRSLHAKPHSTCA